MSGDLMTTLAVVGGASLLAVAARRFHPTQDLPTLEGWALADRGLGPVWTWFLLGSTIFTAYTFIAVPGLVFATGAPAFFSLPYTVIICPLAFVLLPRLWWVAREHGYVTIADFVRGRYGSSALALDSAALSVERELWRVEATRGRVHGTGVFDLCFDWSATAGTGWTLTRVLD